MHVNATLRRSPQAVPLNNAHYSLTSDSGRIITTNQTYWLSTYVWRRLVFNTKYTWCV